MSETPKRTSLKDGQISRTIPACALLILKFVHVIAILSKHNYLKWPHSKYFWECEPGWLMFHVSFWHWLLASNCGQKIATLNAIYFGPFGYPVATSWLKFEHFQTAASNTHHTAWPNTLNMLQLWCCMLHRNVAIVLARALHLLFEQVFRPIWTLNSSRKCEIQTKVHWPWYDRHHCSLELPTPPSSKTGTMGAESMCSASARTVDKINDPSSCFNPWNFELFLGA